MHFYLELKGILLKLKGYVKNCIRLNVFSSTTNVLKLLYIFKLKN